MDSDRKPTGLPVFQCGHGDGGGDKCNLHFIVENEIMSTKGRLDKFEERTSKTFTDLQRSFTDLSTDVKTFMSSQNYRDREYDRMGNETKANTNDISDIKSSLKLLIDSNTNVTRSVVDISDTLRSLNSTMVNMDKSIVSKDEINNIVKSAIIEEDHTRKTKWFDSVPAKISTIVAVLTFAAYWIGKLIILILATTI